MAHIFEPRVRETSQVTGTGNIELAGAMRGSLTFDEVMANGDTCDICISYDSMFQECTATFVEATTDTPAHLVRGTTYRSRHSNGTVDTSNVSFPAGVKTIIMTSAASRAQVLLDALRFNTAQSLSSGQKQQVLDNLGLLIVAAQQYQPLDADLTNLAANLTAAGYALAIAANAAAQRTLLALGDAATFNAASQAEAEAGAAADKLMSPLRTAQAITKLALHPPIATVSASAASAINFDSTNIGAAFDGTTYDFFEIRFDLSVSLDVTNILGQVGTGAGPTYESSNYAWIVNTLNGGVNTPGTGAADSSLLISSSVSNQASAYVTGVIRFSKPNRTDKGITFHWKAEAYLNDGSMAMRTGMGRRTVAGALSAFRIIPHQGTVTGVASLYGYRKS